MGRRCVSGREELAELEFENKSMGARNRVGIGLSYRLARLHSLGAELILWNPLLCSLKVLSSHLNWGARLDSFDPLLNSR